MTSAGTTHLRPPFCTAAVADLKPSVLVGGLRPYFNRPAVAQVVPYRCERGLAMPLALPVSLSLSLSAPLGRSEGRTASLAGRRQ